MPSLSIKKIPEDLLESLRAQAKRHHRSLQGEVMAILEESAKPKNLSLEQLSQRINELGLQTPDQSTGWIRELRDAR